MKSRLIRFCLLAGLAGLLAACEATIANRGNILDADKLAAVKQGVTTREEVISDLGTPTEVGTFDDKSWYYIGSQTKQYSFLDPEVTKEQAVQIRFNDEGVVTAVAYLDLSRQQDIEPVDRITPTYGRNDTFMKQLLGDMAHPTIPNTSRNTNPGGGT